MSQPTKQDEATRLVLAAVAGEASTAELEQLQAMLSEDPGLTSFVVDLMNQESWLAWHSSKSSGGEIRDDLLQQITASVLASAEEEQLGAGGHLGDGVPPTGGPPRPKHRGPQRGPDRTPHGWNRFASWAGAVAACLLVGAAAGYLLRGAPQPASVAASTDRLPQGSDYAVRYVGGTACLWNPSDGRDFDTSREVGAGESLSLLQGIAELDFELPHGSADLTIEGPAGLVVTQGRSASLNHGTFTVETSPDADGFRLQTPSGQVEFRGGTSAGVRVVGGNVELHVFYGGAKVTVLWAASSGDGKVVEVDGGAAVSFVASEDGRIQIDRGVAEKSSFAAELPMYADALQLPAAYEEAVLKSGPLLYWRFEDAGSDRVVDRSGNGFDGQVIGVIEQVRGPSNTSLSLGSGYTGEAIGSYVQSLNPVSDRLGDGYAIELWFKPSHYHWGSLVSILDCRRDSGNYSGHGVSLELGGARVDSVDIERPAKVRFLHRDPPGPDVAVGTSCFSDSPYTLRRWQHLVAVKNADELELFVDGERVGVEKDNSSLAPGLSVILGQLDENQHYRRFVGHIDEVAIYPRPLSGSEVAEHLSAAKSRDKSQEDPNTSKSAGRSRRPPRAI